MSPLTHLEGDFCPQVSTMGSSVADNVRTAICHALRFETPISHGGCVSQRLLVDDVTMHSFMFVVLLDALHDAAHDAAIETVSDTASDQP